MLVVLIPVPLNAWVPHQGEILMDAFAIGALIAVSYLPHFATAGLAVIALWHLRGQTGVIAWVRSRIAMAAAVYAASKAAGIAAPILAAALGPLPVPLPW